jgi:hypothetical protein
MIPSMSVHVFKKNGKGLGGQAKVVNFKGTVTEDSRCKNSRMEVTTSPQKSAESNARGEGTCSAVFASMEATGALSALPRNAA